jgi:hypothetical protein
MIGLLIIVQMFLREVRGILNRELSGDVCLLISVHFGSHSGKFFE